MIARPDGTLVWANAAWCTLCAFNGPEDAIGRNLRCIQGVGTDRAELKRLMDGIRSQATVSATLINYDRRGLPFRHTVDVVPLADPHGSVSLFRATSREVSRLQEHGRCTLDALWNQAEELDGRRAIDTCRAAFDARDEVAGCSALESPCPMGSMGSVPRALPCKHPGQPAMVVLTRAQPPYAIVWASEGWLGVCGYSAAEVLGRDLKLVQGPGTDRQALGRLMAAVRAQVGVEGIPLVNYDKHGQPFQHLLSVEPVFEHGPHAPPSLYRAISTQVRSLACGAPLGATHVACAAEAWARGVADAHANLGLPPPVPCGGPHGGAPPGAAQHGGAPHGAAMWLGGAACEGAAGEGAEVEENFWGEELESLGVAWEGVAEGLELLALERRVAEAQQHLVCAPGH